MRQIKLYVTHALRTYAGLQGLQTAWYSRGVAPATTGTTMAVPLFEKCGPSGTCKTVIKKSGSIDAYAHQTLTFF